MTLSMKLCYIEYKAPLLVQCGVEHQIHLRNLEKRRLFVIFHSVPSQYCWLSRLAGRLFTSKIEKRVADMDYVFSFYMRFKGFKLTGSNIRAVITRF